MPWVSPDGFVDPSADWSDEANTYDGNTASNSNYDSESTGYSGYLELTHAALNCDKVRFWCGDEDGNADIDIDVYYDGGWHSVYTGAFAHSEWVEKSIPAGTKSVTAMRIRLDVKTGDENSAYIYEVDFNEVEVGIARPLVGGSLASGSLAGKGLAR